MKHIEYWVANDKTRFSSEYECRKYEFQQELNANHTLRAVKGDEVYYGEKLMEDEVYNSIESVIVTSKDDLKLIEKLWDWSGFFYNIDSIGVWKYDDYFNMWVRKENANEN